MLEENSIMSGILGDVQLISQTILCYCIILFGLLCAIPVGITTVSIAMTFTSVLFGPFDVNDRGTLYCDFPAF